MPVSAFKHATILRAREAHAAGENVTETLRHHLGLDANTPEIIELAYDLEAGSYIRAVEQNRAHAVAYATELAAILDRHIEPGATLLDIGTGELTTLSLVARRLARMPEAIHAFDISWSRVAKGVGFAGATMGVGFSRLTAFVADIAEIPLRTGAVSITTSSHALEPNGGSLPVLMQELFRVTRDRLVLFEPSWELAGAEGRARMERLGYIRDLAGVVRSLGGTVLETIPIRNVSDPLNPTLSTIVAPPAASPRVAGTSAQPRSVQAPFSVPGTDLPLERVGDVWFSPTTGLCFPILKSIPILRTGTAILASALKE